MGKKKVDLKAASMVEMSVAVSDACWAGKKDNSKVVLKAALMAGMKVVMMVLS